MKSLKDLLTKKADDIDRSGVRTDLELIQIELDRYFNGSIKVVKLTDGVARVESKSAALASTMRMQQHQLIEDLNSSLKNKLERFMIRIV